MAIFAFGIGIWVWPYWQASNDVPANKNGTTAADEQMNAVVPLNTNGTIVAKNNVGNANSVPTSGETESGSAGNGTNVAIGGDTNTTLRYDTPMSENERTHGNASRKEVVLTFDAGSGTQSAQAILDALEKHEVPGVFFVTGTWAQKNTEILKKISASGHEIYNHTMTHPHLPSLDDTQIAQELEQTESIMKNATGVTTQPYFRAPYGDRNAHVLSVAAEQGYTSVYWTTDALDWEESSGVTAEQVKNRIVQNLRPGAIFLMHVGDTLTGAVLDDVIAEIQKLGYAVVRLDHALEQ